MRLFVVTAMLLLLILPSLAQSDETPTPQGAPFVHRNSIYTALTYHQPTGNRLVSGSGTFPTVTSLDYPLPGVPLWLLAVPEDPLLWHVILQDGTHWRLSDVVEQTGRMASVAPPTTMTSFSLMPSPPEMAPYTHPVQLGERLLYVTDSGDLALLAGDVLLDRLALNIQPDARLSVNAAGQVALYAQATNQRYVHGIMGDDLEGTVLMVVAVVDDALQVVARVDLPGDHIYEGLSPMWADVDGDGIEDLITTVSNGHDGARNRVYFFDGTMILREVDGPVIGQPNRWQHQIAWGPFGADGESLLVDVLTPHIGGIVRFHRYTGDALEVIASIGGHTSHVINTRNLDMAVAGDFNGDGVLEIALPTQDRTRIEGIQLTVEGAQVVWSLPVDGVATSNLAAISANGRSLALAVGTEDGRIRVWLSQ